jgi:TetR/AcrR family transcriptional regulator, cholesterol catabolism regulator
MMSKDSTRSRTRTSQPKLRLLLRHAAQVFSDKGYDGASIRDISRASGISLAGVYYYVRSKQELLYLIQIHAFRSILARLEKRLRGVKDPSEKLRLLVQNHLDYFLRHPLEMKVLAKEDEALEGEYRREVQEVKRRYYGLAVSVFEELRKAGMARRLNPRIAVLSLFGMMNWVHTWHRPRIDPQADALAEAIAGMFLYGVTSNQLALRARATRASRERVVVAERMAG